nr:hypothetical protein [Deltaproteobacteria bacterium]
MKSVSSSVTPRFFFVSFAESIRSSKKSDGLMSPRSTARLSSVSLGMRRNRTSTCASAAIVFAISLISNANSQPSTSTVARVVPLVPVAFRASRAIALTSDTVTGASTAPTCTMRRSRTPWIHAKPGSSSAR